MLHAQFAINDLRQKMFGSNISDLIRFASSYFRHLSGAKHRVKEDDDWTEYFRLVGEAGWLSAVKGFAIRKKGELSKMKKMRQVVKAYRLDTQLQIFGDSPNATKFLDDPDSSIPSHVDYPAAVLHSFLFFDFIYETMHASEVLPAPHLSSTLLRCLLPLFEKFNKNRYGGMVPTILSTQRKSSQQTNSLLDQYTSFSISGSPKAQAADRVNEGVVKDLSSFPGERAKNASQVRIRNHPCYDS